MKKLFEPTIIFLLLLTGSISIYGQTDKKAEIRKLEKELSSLSKSSEKDFGTMANLNNKIAKLYFGLKDYKKALNNFESELSIRNTMVDTGQNAVSKSKVMFNIVGLKRLSGDYENALALAFESIKYNESKFGVISKETADAHKQSAEVAFLWKRPAYYTKHYDLALSIYKKLKPVDTLRIIDLLVLKGSNEGFGDHDRSLKTLNEALELYKSSKKDDIDLVSRIYLNISATYSYKGKFAEALKNAQEALKIKKGQDELSVSIAYVYLNIGIYFQKMGNIKSAIIHFDKALEITEKLLGADNPRTLRILSVKAGALFDIDSLQIAKKLFEKIVNSRNDIEHNFAYNYALGYLARIDEKNGRYYDFIERYNKIIANRIKYDGEHNPDIAHTYHKLAMFYRNNNKLDLFEKYILKSLESSVVSGYVPEKIEYLGYLSDYLDSGLNVSDSLVAIGFSFVNQTLNDASYDADKQNAIENIRNFFESALYYESKKPEVNPEKSFSNLIQCFENSKSILLTSNLSESESMKTAALPDSIQEKYKFLKSNLLYFEKEWLNAEIESDTSNLTFFRTEADFFRKSLDSLKNNILVNYPRFGYNVNKPELLPNLSEIRKLIGKKEMIFDYFVGNKNSFLLSINQNSVYFKMIDSAYKKEFDVLIDQFNQPEKVQKDLKKSLGEYVSSANLLSDSLLKNLPDSSQINTIIIIPDGNLHYLPFEALLKGKTEIEKATFKTLPYVIKKYNVKYAYNLNVLKKQLVKSSGANESEVYAFAPEYDNETKQHVPLSGAVEELKMLEFRYEGKYFYNQKIAKAALLENLNKSPEFVHLAMHTYAPDSSDAYMLLSKQKKEDEDRLWIREIMALPLEQTKLLVLSSCQTGIGTYRAGEGLLSIGRGFAYSGTKSMVTTLWPFYDKAAAELMKSFYDYLDKGFDKAEALRRAKLDFIEKAGSVSAHPVYWASPLVWGNTEPVKIPQKSIFNAWFFLYVGLGLATIAGILIFYSGRRNKNPA